MNVLSTVAGGQYTLITQQGELPVTSEEAAGGTPVATSSQVLELFKSAIGSAFTEIISLPITSGGSDAFLIFASVCAQVDTDAHGIHFQITLDGVPVALVSWSLFFASASHNLCGGSNVTLAGPIPAGDHTVALQWAGDDESTERSIDPTFFAHASIQMLRLTFV